MEEMKMKRGLARALLMGIVGILLSVVYSIGIGAILWTSNAFPADGGIGNVMVFTFVVLSTLCIVITVVSYLVIEWSDLFEWFVRRR